MIFGKSEHKIYYKYDKEVPQYLLDELKMAADKVSQLDQKWRKFIENQQDKRAYRSRRITGNIDK